MTHPARNGPCPCGSGRKYKRCCLTKAGPGANGAAAEDEGSARSAPNGDGPPREWSADALPVPGSVEDGAPRPVVLLVVDEEGVVIHGRILVRLSGEIEAVAHAIAEGVRGAAEGAGRRPEAIVVRHAETAHALESMADMSGLPVRVDRAAPHLERVARELLEAMSGHALWPPVGGSGTWRGWDLPEEVVADLFRAAARFYEAAPWRIVANEQAPRALLPSGREWTACVLGAAGEAFGLALYSDHSDLVDAIEAEDPDQDLAMRGRLLCLRFERLSNVPPQPRSEQASSHWKLAGPAAYPELMTTNMPGGGVSEGHARDLLVLLEAVPRFVTMHAEVFRDETAMGLPCDPFEWVDEHTGAIFRYEGAARSEPGGASMIDLEVEREIRAIVEEVAGELSGDEDATMEDVVARVSERLGVHMDTVNVRPMAELRGLAPVQVHRLLSADWSDPEGPIRLRRDLPAAEIGEAKTLRFVRNLLEMAEPGGLGRTQAGNLKVAVVREAIGRCGLEEIWGPTSGRRVREDDVWPLHEARVLADLAGLLRHRKTRFDLTRAARRLIVPPRAGELYALLFEACFRRFNIFYGGYDAWPELQHQVAFTLLRLGQVSRTWSAGERLVEEVVLPFALEHAPQGFLDPPWLLERHVLRRLVGFGLMEFRELEESHREYRVTPLFDRFLAFAV